MARGAVVRRGVAYTMKPKVSTVSLGLGLMLVLTGRARFSRVPQRDGP